MPSCGTVCYGIPEMPTKPATRSAANATHAGCVRRGLGTLFQGAAAEDDRRPVEDDRRPSILQLDTEGLTANKISVIDQLACKNKAFIIVPQETH